MISSSYWRLHSIWLPRCSDYGVSQCYGVIAHMQGAARLTRHRPSCLTCELCHLCALVCESVGLFLCQAWFYQTTLNNRSRGLRKSRSRQCLSGIVILMLAANTAYVILALNFLIIQIPSAVKQEVRPTRLINQHYIAQMWLARLNVSTWLLSKDVISIALTP